MLLEPTINMCVFCMDLVELYPTYLGHNNPNQELMHLELPAKFFFP